MAIKSFLCWLVLAASAAAAVMWFLLRCGRHHRRKEAFTVQPSASADLFAEPVGQLVGAVAITRAPLIIGLRRQRRC